MRSAKDESSHLLRQPGARVPAGVFNRFPQRCCFFCGPLECCLDEYGVNMVMHSLSKANEGFLCSEGCYVQRAAGLLCNVRALAFRLISRSEPSRLRPLLDGM